MFCAEIEFGTPAFDEALRLRDDILRKPLGLKFTIPQIKEEYKQIHLGCYDDEVKLVGVLSLVEKEDGWIKMRQVAVAENMQGKGIGRRLVIFSEDEARRRGFDKMELNARETAVVFYKAMNYQTVGDRFEEVNIPHFRMEKEL